jgi:hypothetical protein
MKAAFGVRFLAAGTLVAVAMGWDPLCREKYEGFKPPRHLERTGKPRRTSYWIKQAFPTIGRAARRASHTVVAFWACAILPGCFLIGARRHDRIHRRQVFHL